MVKPHCLCTKEKFPRILDNDFPITMFLDKDFIFFLDTAVHKQNNNFWSNKYELHTTKLILVVGNFL